MNAHTHTGILARTLSCMRTHAYLQLHTHAHTHTHTHTTLHNYVNAHTHGHTNTHTIILAHTLSCMRTHAYLHTHTCTHAHTHTLICWKQHHEVRAFEAYCFGQQMSLQCKKRVIQPMFSCACQGWGRVSHLDPNLVIICASRCLWMKIKMMQRVCERERV